jgi:hypothetical protein
MYILLVIWSRTCMHVRPATCTNHVSHQWIYNWKFFPKNTSINIHCVVCDAAVSPFAPCRHDHYPAVIIKLATQANPATHNVGHEWVIQRHMQACILLITRIGHKWVRACWATAEPPSFRSRPLPCHTPQPSARGIVADVLDSKQGSFCLLLLY